MIAYRYLYLFAIIGMMVAAGTGIGAAQTTSDPTSASTPAASTTSSASATTAGHKSAHHKKKKSVAITAGKAKPGTASTLSAKKTGTASTLPTKKTGTASTVPTKKTGTASILPGKKTSTVAAKAIPGTPTSATTQPGAAKAIGGKKTAKASSTSRKKNKSKLAKTGTKPLPGHGSGFPLPMTVYPSTLPSAANAASAPVTVAKSPGDSGTQITVSAPAAPTHSGGGPEVDTGLPVARHSGIAPDGSAILPQETPASYKIASAFPISPAISTIGSYLPSGHVKIPVDNFTFTNFNRRARNSYPWKMDIYTTIFWIGEGGTTVSSTDNVESAWDQDWRSNNGGSDTPNDREGYMPANHAARMNPFYVALPFNDLAFPDKARRWLPAGWYRSPRDGKQVSACKDRWVEIKNAQGETCYAQWEDVGPLRYDHAEYVFGEERPDTLTRAGLDVSPAVADYLNITGKNCVTRWRFVDDADVPPGYWLKYDEEALIFRAMHDLKEDPTHILPIQRATAPIDDDSDTESNKKRLSAAKG
jgi:hypothetical protein